jgi:hypothetical protein
MSSGWAVYVDGSEAFAVRAVTREQAVGIVRRHHPNALSIEARVPLQATVFDAMEIADGTFKPWSQPGGN